MSHNSTTTPGNEIFEYMLDRRMVYTCSRWEHAANLDEAQEAKLHFVCRKLNLSPGMRVLDIGCGWAKLRQIRGGKLWRASHRNHRFPRTTEASTHSLFRPASRVAAGRLPRCARAFRSRCVVGNVRARGEQKLSNVLSSCPTGNPRRRQIISGDDRIE